MISRTTKLKWRRILRRQRRNVADIGANGEEQLEKHVIRRLIRLPSISRFLLGWIGLLFILSIGVIMQTRALGGKYQTLQPKPGGTFTEGIVGSFTNANPLYASSPADSTVSNLVFSGLLKYDKNNNLIGSLAESWNIDQAETSYTVKLKPNLKWHDGESLTSKDVVFTYKTIQNPETKSYLYSSWQNIKVDASDDRTIVFTLPNSLSSFPHSLTNGIIPEHILSGVNPAQLRSNSFNNETPVGSGPFSFAKVEVVGEEPDNRQERVALNAFGDYYAGRPKLDTFITRTFPNEKALGEAYASKEVTAAAGLPNVPENVLGDKTSREYDLTFTSEVLVFFKTNQDVLKDTNVRKALVLATDKKQIFDKLPYPLTSVDSPLLKSHIGYDKSLLQTLTKPEEAKKVLDNAGWIVDPASGIRSKDGNKLSFRLYSQNTSEYTSVAGSLQKQWREIGVDMQVELQPDQEFQSTLALHNYDALLYGIALGSDPDVYAYWHSSQADPRSPTRLNFSEYKSVPADRALEGGRTRSDPQVRTVKYRPFLEAWKNESPALALYQPRFMYVAREPFHGFEKELINTAADRFTSVEQWTMREGLADRK